MSKRWLLFTVGVVLCITAWLFLEYQRPRVGVNEIRAAQSISAEKLYNEYAAHEERANARFLGKVIVVDGIIQEIVHDQSSPGLLLKGSRQGGGIHCGLQDNKQLQELKVGSRVQVKGRCTGYLMDVNLIDVITNDNKESPKNQ